MKLIDRVYSEDHIIKSTRRIYRIYSEDPKVENYIDYEPSRSPWVRNLALGSWITDKTRQERLKKSKCVRSKPKKSKSFSETPKDAIIIDVIMSIGEIRDTLITTTARASFDLYLDLKILPKVNTDGRPSGGLELIAEDGGIGKTIQREKEFYEDDGLSM